MPVVQSVVKADVKAGLLAKQAGGPMSLDDLADVIATAITNAIHTGSVSVTTTCSTGPGAGIGTIA